MQSYANQTAKNTKRFVFGLRSKELNDSIRYSRLRVAMNSPPPRQVPSTPYCLSAGKWYRLCAKFSAASRGTHRVVANSTRFVIHPSRRAVRIALNRQTSHELLLV